MERIYFLALSFCLLFSIASAQVPMVNQTVIRDDLIKAEQWFDTKGFHAARHELEQVYPLLSTIEEKRDALFVLLQSAFEDQEYENAYQWSGDFLRAYPNDGRLGTVSFIHGVSAFQTKRTDKAISMLDSFLSKNVDHPLRGAGLFWRAMCKLEKGDWQTAELDLENCYKDSTTRPYHDVVLLGWALSLERRGEYQKAISLLEEFIRNFSDSKLLGDATIRLASLSLRVGKPLRAVQLLDNYEPTFTQRQEFALIRAEAYLQLGRFHESQSEYQKFINEFPKSSFNRHAEYGLAWSYVKQGNYTAAKVHLDSLGRGNDSLAFTSLYQSAVLSMLQDKPLDAISRFDSLTQKSPYDALAEDAYYQMGMTQYRSKRYIEARRSFQLAARLFPESQNRAKSYHMLGETNIALGDFSNAQYAFARVRKLNAPADILATSMFQEGIALYHLGRFKSSADLFNNFIKQFPKDSHLPEAYVWRAEALYQDGKFSDAERLYAEALKQFPNNPKRVDAYYGLSWTQFEQKKFSQAALSFERFISAFPNDERILEATLRQADCYFFMGEYEKSSALYASVANMKTDSRISEYAVFQIAMSYIQRGETERGIEQLRNFLSRYPQSLYNEVVQFNIAWAYFSKNRFSEAIEEFRRLINQYPESQLMPRVCFNMGDAFYNLRQYDSARIYYQRVPKDFPTSPLVADALQGLQYTYEAEGKPAAAIAQIDTLLKTSSSGISQEELLMKKGDILFGQGDFGGAVLEYQKLLSLKPSKNVQAKTYYQLARAYELENNTEQAIKYYERILSDYKDADFAPNAALALGIAHIKMKQFKSAAIVFQEFEEIFPNSPLISEVRYNLGMALFNEKDKKPAFLQFQKVIQNHPDDIFADRSRLQIARIHTSRKEFKASLDTLNNLISRRNDDLAAEALLIVGENYLSLKKTADALQAFKDVYEQYDEYKLLVERAHLGAGECYVRLRNLKLARAEFEKVVNSAVDPSIKKEAQERLRKLK